VLDQQRRRDIRRAVAVVTGFSSRPLADPEGAPDSPQVSGIRPLAPLAERAQRSTRFQSRLSIPIRTTSGSPERTSFPRNWGKLRGHRHRPDRARKQERRGPAPGLLTGPADPAAAARVTVLRCEWSVGPAVASAAVVVAQRLVGDGERRCGAAAFALPRVSAFVGGDAGDQEGGDRVCPPRAGEARSHSRSAIAIASLVGSPNAFAARAIRARWSADGCVARAASALRRSRHSRSHVSGSSITSHGNSSFA
jgi:hypothetical protein